MSLPAPPKQSAEGIRLSPLLLLGLVTLLGLGLRFWKVGYGLPDVTFTNEEITCYPALNLASQGFNPRNFVHPNFYYYLYFLGDAVFILASRATGRFKTLQDAWLLYKTNPTVYFVIGRSIAALLGTLTIPLTYLMGKKLFGGKTGILAAFFLTISLVHVQWSQIAYMDVPLTFFLTATFLFSLSALERGKSRDFIWAGLFAGLSTSTKYHGIPALLWGPLACYLLRYPESKNPLSVLRETKAWFFLAFFFLGFSLGTPFWILDFPEFKKQFLMMAGWFRPHGGGHLGIEGDWNWGYYLITTLPYSVGLPVLIASVAGLFILFNRMDRSRIFFLSFPLAYFLAAGLTKIRQAKYMMPLVPFLCVTAAFFMVFMIENYFREKSKLQNLALLTTAVLIGFPSLASTLRYDRLKDFTDTRQLAIEWVDAHVPSESKVLVGNNTVWHRMGGPQTTDLDPGLTDQKLGNRSTLKSLETYRKEGFRYVVLDEWHLGLLFTEEARNPKYQEAIQRYREFLADLKKSAQLVAVFSPYREKNVPFDRENAFLASRSLWKFRRFGPVIEIYKI